jgi:hypothetical protein
MIYAQIKNGIVVNNIVLNDTSLLSLFGQGFDCNPIEIDNLNPVPQIGWTYNGTNFLPPVIPTPPAIPLNQQYTPTQYGQLLISEFTASNTQRGLTAAQIFSVAQNLTAFYILLQTGSLQTFLDEIDNIPVDGVVITTAIVAQFQAAIEAYLADD